MWGFESSLSVCLVWLAWFIRTGCCSCIGLDTSQQWMWSGQGLKHPTGLVRQMLQSTFLWAITRIKKLPETGHGGANARSRNVTSPSFAGQLMLSATAANPAAAAAASSSTTKKEREKNPPVRTCRKLAVHAPSHRSGHLSICPNQCLCSQA